MDWARILAYVTGTVDQELLGRNEYLAAENPFGQKTRTGGSPAPKRGKHSVGDDPAQCFGRPTPPPPRSGQVRVIIIRRRRDGGLLGPAP
jgi:hypothetical protein